MPAVFHSYFDIARRVTRVRRSGMVWRRQVAPFPRDNIIKYELRLSNGFLNGKYTYSASSYTMMLMLMCTCVWCSHVKRPQSCSIWRSADKMYDEVCCFAVGKREWERVKESHGIYWIRAVCMGDDGEFFTNTNYAQNGMQSFEIILDLISTSLPYAIRFKRSLCVVGNLFMGFS